MLLRVVLDTNVLISAVISPAGLPGRIRQSLQDGRFWLVLSEALLAEYRRALNYPKVARRHQLTTGEINQLLEELTEFATLVRVTHSVQADLRDPKDLLVLECALAGSADLIVTGDSDLLELGDFGGIRILNPTAFIALLEEV